MQYRPFGKNSDKGISALGLGAMRLPTIKDGERTIVDESKSIEMIRYSIDQGINYVDTAYPYHDGTSETVVGKALAGGYREKVMLTTKLPCWMIETPSDFDRILDEQLTKLQTSCVDFYLLHALFTGRWEKMKELKALDFMKRAQKDGRIKKIGFSYHDDSNLFKSIVDSYDWDMCQIQYNFLNEEVQAGTGGLKYAAGKGIPVLVMEPLLGGTLAQPPADVKKIWDSAKKDPVDMALKWIWDKNEVACVLSGMSNLEQVKQNIASANVSAVNSLTEEECELFKQVVACYKSYQIIPCTKCEYCQPCPSGVKIPRVFEIYNQGIIHNKIESGKGMYNWHMKDSEKAVNCTQCKACEDNCPQKITISEWMPKIHDQLVFR